MADVGEMAPDFTLRGASGDEFDAELAAREQARAADLLPPGHDQRLNGSIVRRARDNCRFPGTRHRAVRRQRGRRRQPPAVHRRTSSLPFDLLVDEGLRVADAYDALKTEGTLIKRKIQRISRTVVIVGKDGRIIFRAAGAPPPGELLGGDRNAKDG